ncbi:hypothetical protein [Kluyvera georgiana]|uniref:hypothetical protein n=1 Tax=Kluyvera georgiana TaxID=73098 RepID=UPI00080716E3|nr:hypothetical protein [Kluyvera georgiana]
MSELTMRSVLKDLSVIPIASAILYVLTYAYLSGESYYYSYPAEFIDVNINIILNTSFKILPIFLPLLFLFWFDITGKLNWLFYILSGFYAVWVLLSTIFSYKNPLKYGELFGTEKAIPLIALIVIVTLFMVCVVLAKSIARKKGEKCLMAFIMMFFLVYALAFLSGFLKSSENKVAFAIDEGYTDIRTRAPYIIISKNSNGLILGRCDGYDKDFYISPYDEKAKFRRVTNASKLNFYRHCFDDRWYLYY